MTPSQRNALEWLQKRGGDGLFDKHGVAMAAGESAPVMRVTWNALAKLGLIEFYNLLGKGRGRLRVVPLTDAQRRLLRKLALGATICHARDGEHAWLSDDVHFFLRNEDITALRNRGYLTLKSGELHTWDVISAKGREYLSRAPAQQPAAPDAAPPPGP